MAKFDYYTEVHVLHTVATLASGIAGSIGVVFGMSSGPLGDSYAVFIEGETYTVYESDLVQTGRTFEREDFYDGATLKVPAERYVGDGLTSSD